MVSAGPSSMELHRIVLVPSLVCVGAPGGCNHTGLTTKYMICAGRENKRRGTSCRSDMQGREHHARTQSSHGPIAWRTIVEANMGKDIHEGYESACRDSLVISVVYNMLGPCL